MAESNENTHRRGLRVRKPTSKALENRYVKNLERSGLVVNISSRSESSSEDEIDEEFFDIQERGTPSVLKNTSNAQGEKIFHFEGKKTKKGLLDKIRESHEVTNQRTPQAHRSKIKKAIEHELHNAESGNDPFSDSGSEYQCSEESSESEEENSQESTNSDSSDHDPNVKCSKMPSKILKNIKITKVPNANKNKKYTLNTDDYFCNQASKKIVTSDHTLEKLETPRLAQDQIQKLLKNMKLSENHQECMKKLYKQNKSMFTKWLYVLHENFNILVYGLGSKKKLIEEFSDEFLQNSPVIVVNGFFPSLSIKDILDGIITNLLELKRNPANVYECCDIIEQEFGSIHDTHLYLIIHNIDGEMLRNNKAQNVLARLAAVKNIHLIASIDHINAPLLWDHSKLSKFNYTWWDMTSYLPYIDETSFESSMMIQKSGEFALSSLRNVFVSLTTNSKGIYLTIVKHQLDNSKNQYYQGLAFKDLYSSCRESFLVSSDLALRAQLTEFVDHKMVKFKRSIDGVEHLVIPIANSLLQKFLDEHKNS
ncbi:hypothetical protein WA026_011556 [Henosepilachna vigintioctopunctata]|uniref:Origin recognition complex subunit 2 n=1 Tax=Henosepilachna vigintioctopunctata TaxID=420089 RepID=A0AAW1TJR8_9CUCU